MARPFRINVEGDLREVRRYFKALGPGIDRAASRALNKTATSVRAESAREIQKKRNLKIGLIKKQLFIDRATYRRLTASIVASGKPIPIRHFKANETRQGVSVLITKGKGRTKLQKHGNKSFIVHKLGSNVFVRSGNKRLPIEKWPAVSGFPTVFVQSQVQGAMRRTAGRRWPTLFNQELRFELRKATAAARSSR